MHLEGKPERDHIDVSLVVTFFPEGFRFVTPTPITAPSPQKSGSFCLFVFNVALHLSSGASVGGTSYFCFCVHLKNQCPIHEIAFRPGH